jgi:hypothetical protein
MPAIPNDNGDRFPTAFVGIDPGASGGLCLIQDDMVEAVAMPGTDKDVWIWFLLRVKSRFRPFAMIEQVGGYIGKGQDKEGNQEKGGGAANGSAMFKFGRSAGMLEGFLVAAGIPYERVVPRKWQKGVGLVGKKKGETRTSFKNRGKALAQRLFPDEDVTLKTADAILIADFCRRMKTGLGKMV